VARRRTHGPILMASAGSTVASANPTWVQGVYTGGRGYGARETTLWVPVNISAAAPGPNLTFGGVVKKEWTWFPEFNDGLGNTTPHLWNRLSEFLQLLHDIEQEDADGDGQPMHASIAWTELYGGTIPFGADTGAAWIPFSAAGVESTSANYLATHATVPVQYRHFLDADGATSSVFPTRAPNNWDPNLLALLKIASESRQMLFQQVCPITTAKGNAIHKHLIGDHISYVMANATGGLANFELTGGIGTPPPFTTGNGGRIQFPSGIASTATGSRNVTLPTSGRDGNIQVSCDEPGYYVGLLRDTVDRDKHELVCWTQTTDSGGGSGTINFTHRGWAGTTAQTWDAGTTELRLARFDTSTWGTYSGGDWSQTTWKNWLGRPGPTATVSGYVSYAAPNNTGDASNASFAGSTYKLWDWTDRATGIAMATSGPPIPRSFANYFGQLRCLPPDGTTGPGTGANAGKWPVLSLDTTDGQSRPKLEWLSNTTLPWNGAASLATKDAYMRRLFVAFNILNATTVLAAHASMPWIAYGVKIATWFGGDTHGGDTLVCDSLDTDVSASAFNLTVNSTLELSGANDVAGDAPTACMSAATMLALYFTVGEGRQYRDRFYTGYTSCRLALTPDVDADDRGMYSNGITDEGKMWMLRNAKALGLGVALQVTGRSANDANEDNKAAARISQWIIDYVAPVTWEAANSTRGNNDGTGNTDDPDGDDFTGLTAPVFTVEVWTGYQRLSTYTNTPTASTEAAALARNFKRQMATADYRRRSAAGRKV
jgi:hypothetical protein